MFRVIFMAISSILQYLLTGILIKFLVFYAAFYLTSDLLPEVIDTFVSRKLIPDLNTLFGQFPEGIWYFMNVFQIPMAVSLMISAMVSRFAIRRIPFIG
ncbi:DUF2523 family protein [Ursidibacter sp. B-7004-1]